jgi:toxin ParE1/3/4
LTKKLVRRAIADADVLTALDYYFTNAPEYALDFIDDLERAYQHIEQYPASGSPRYVIELELAELRAWKCHKYPYVIFYAERAEQIEVWRVLHEKQDLPESLSR